MQRAAQRVRRRRRWAWSVLFFRCRVFAGCLPGFCREFLFLGSKKLFYHRETSMNLNPTCFWMPKQRAFASFASTHESFPPHFASFAPALISCLPCFLATFPFRVIYHTFAFLPALFGQGTYSMLYASVRVRPPPLSRHLSSVA